MLAYKNKYILGISCFYHDSAAAIISNGKIIAAVHEERFSRLKHDSSFPFESVNYCLEEARIDINDLECIVFYDNPMSKLERILVSQLRVVPAGKKVWRRLEGLAQNWLWYKVRAIQEREEHSSRD